MAKWNEITRKWEWEPGELEASVTQVTVPADERDETPEALHIRYSAKTKRYTVDLDGGATFSFPASRLQGLQNATSTQLSDVHVLPGGEVIEWSRLDLHFSVGGILMGVFGNRAWMKELARKGGSTTSERKKKSSAANGAKGGRPRKAGTTSPTKPTRLEKA